MSEAVEKEKEELRSLLEGAQSQVPVLNEAIANVDSVSSSLTGRQEELTADINRIFDALAQALEQR